MDKISEGEMCRNWDEEKKICIALHVNCNVIYSDCDGDPTNLCEVGDSYNDEKTYEGIA